jgi:hypothetical protein
MSHWVIIDEAAEITPEMWEDLLVKTQRSKPSFTVPNAAWTKRQRVWRHNSFRGHASMMLSQLQAILRSDSITPEARDAAEQMLTLADSLAFHLEKRVDP